MTQEKEHLGRRDFIKKVGLSAGAAGVAAVAVSETTEAATPTKAKTSGAGYKETDHVRTYYELAAF